MGDQSRFDAIWCFCLIPHIVFLSWGHQIVKEHVFTAHHIPQNTCRVHLFHLQDHLFFWRFVFHFEQVFLPCFCGLLWHQTGQMDDTQKLSPSRILFSPANQKIHDNKIRAPNTSIFSKFANAFFTTLRIG